MKTVSRHTLYPGCFFIDRRVGENGNWMQVYYDLDEEVMKTRMAYWRENRKPGESWRLISTSGTLVEMSCNGPLCPEKN